MAMKWWDSLSADGSAVEHLYVNEETGEIVATVAKWGFCYAQANVGMTPLAQFTTVGQAKARVEKVLAG